jgi:hypothetical protein
MTYIQVSGSYRIVFGQTTIYCYELFNIKNNGTAYAVPFTIKICVIDYCIDLETTGDQAF